MAATSSGGSVQVVISPPGTQSTPQQSPSILTQLSPSSSHHPPMRSNNNVSPRDRTPGYSRGSNASSSTADRDDLNERNRRSKICSVCLGEAETYHLQYGASACFSCRAFFRRIVQQKAGKPDFKCKFSGDCEITASTRRRCQPCRYSRCLAAGMQPDAVLDDKRKQERFRKLIKKQEEEDGMENGGVVIEPEHHRSNKRGETGGDSTDNLNGQNGIDVIPSGVVHQHTIKLGVPTTPTPSGSQETNKSQLQPEYKTKLTFKRRRRKNLVDDSKSPHLGGVTAAMTKKLTHMDQHQLLDPASTHVRHPSGSSTASSSFRIDDARSSTAASPMKFLGSEEKASPAQPVILPQRQESILGQHHQSMLNQTTRHLLQQAAAVSSNYQSTLAAKNATAVFMDHISRFNLSELQNPAPVMLPLSSGSSRQTPQQQLSQQQHSPGLRKTKEFDANFLIENLTTTMSGGNSMRQQQPQPSRLDLDLTSMIKSEQQQLTSPKCLHDQQEQQSFAGPSQQLVGGFGGAYGQSLIKLERKVEENNDLQPSPIPGSSRNYLQQRSVELQMKSEVSDSWRREQQSEVSNDGWPQEHKSEMRNNTTWRQEQNVSFEEIINEPPVKENSPKWRREPDVQQQIGNPEFRVVNQLGDIMGNNFEMKIEQSDIQDTKRPEEENLTFSNRFNQQPEQNLTSGASIVSSTSSSLLTAMPHYSPKSSSNIDCLNNISYLDMSPLSSISSHSNDNMESGDLSNLTPSVSMEMLNEETENLFTGLGQGITNRIVKTSAGKAVASYKKMKEETTDQVNMDTTAPGHSPNGKVTAKNKRMLRYTGEVRKSWNASLSNVKFNPDLRQAMIAFHRGCNVGLNTKVLLRRHMVSLVKVFREFALLQPEFMSLTTTDQKKLLFRNAPVFVQYIFGRYISEPGTGADQLNWLIPKPLPGQKSTGEGSSGGGLLTLRISKDEIMDPNLPRISFGEINSSLFMMPPDVAKVFETIAAKLVIPEIDLNCHCLLALVILFSTSYGTILNDPDLITDRCGDMNTVMDWAHEVYGSPASKDILKLIPVLEDMTAFFEENVKWEEMEKSFFDLTAVIALPFTHEEDRWMVSQLERFDQGVHEVSFGEEILNEFVMHTYDVPMSRSFAAKVMKVWAERFRMVLKKHNEFNSLTDGEQVSLWQSNVWDAVALSLARSESLEDGNKQLRFSCGFKDSSIFEDVFKPVVDKKKLKRLSFYNVLHEMDDRVDHFLAMAAEIHPLLADVETFKLISMITIFNLGSSGSGPRSLQQQQEDGGDMMSEGQQGNPIMRLTPKFRTEAHRRQMERIHQNYITVFERLMKERQEEGHSRQSPGGSRKPFPNFDVVRVQYCISEMSRVVREVAAQFAKNDIHVELNPAHQLGKYKHKAKRRTL